MNIPVTVIRAESSASSADAFLLPDGEAHRLGEAIASLRAVPRLFRIRGGLLIEAAGPSLPGAIRLRRVAEDYFIPVDGQLSPAILSDEFPGLTRGGGVVHLASGCFAFDPHSPIPVASWLRLPPRGIGEWEPFPALPANPDALRLIERPSPPAAVLEILGAGEPEGHDPLPTSGPLAEDARPPSSSLGKRIAGRAALGAAKTMAWLGRNLGLGGLARAGANLARHAVESVPRLSEKIIGQQEAALRELLRQLQSGDAERALKRAPIAVADPNQPGRVSGNANLSERNIGYSFAELFRGSGAGSAWLGGGDVWFKLQTEYRRLAEEAVKRGDYRRAAYLLGVLLRDLRGAANVLKTGGRYRDAALLLRDRLNDPVGAAAVFEQAGDFDEAVRLYGRAGEDVKAGDLLRRIGDEARAAFSYRRAAGKLAERREHLQAGDLIRAKLGDSATANGYYSAGWTGELSGAIPCGQRLIDDALVTGELARFDELLDEAERRYGPPAYADAGRIFNYALSVSELLTEERRGDLRDRVRLLFAEHLRAGGAGRVNARIDPLFGGSTREWSPSLRRDAAYATATGSSRQVTLPKPKPLVQGKVRAVVHAQDAGIVFIGTADAVIAWDLRSGQSTTVAHGLRGDLVALCTDRSGGSLYTLVDDESHLRLTAYALPKEKDRKADMLASADIPGNSNDLYLQPYRFDDVGANYVVVNMDGVRSGYHSEMLVAGTAGPYIAHSLGATHWIGEACGMLWDWSSRELVGYRSVKERDGASSWMAARSGDLGWTPANFGHRPKIDCAALDDRTLVIAGIDGDGVVHRSESGILGGSAEIRHCAASHVDGYAAVCLLRANCLAVATGRSQILILRASGANLVPFGKPVKLDSTATVVYLGHHGPTHELVVVMEDGTTLKIPVPTQKRD